MLNKDIYKTPPKKRRLQNAGVANVNDDAADAKAQEVLRYELKTFVCDGQYEKGMIDILDSYLKNVNKAQQQGVWVSGFFGSGKSHLVKMLRSLWLNTEFSDGAAAREIANLPASVKELFLELETTGKREGGLHAASGTLGSSAAGSVRLALLKIVFKSVGLPDQYPVARFVMWLKKEGIYNELKKLVEESGSDWIEELDNFYVAEDLHKALVKVKSNLFASTQLCVETLNNKYPHVNDVSNDEMIEAMEDALTENGKFPLTLLVLDEVQQFIGDNSDRSVEVQEMIETCCKSIGGKLIVVATGQTAVTGTANLKKLEGRFTLRVELSDADVESVVRQVILAKNPDAMEEIETNLQTNLGEITRQLQSTSISHRSDDEKYFAADYPILPVRRRFWENALRALDQTGTDSQLRNQLSLADKVTRENLDKPIGNVVQADFLYFESASELLQTRMLPRKVYEQTVSWNEGSEDERLMARACGLVFLINKVASHNDEIGIKSTVDTVCDLMVEDLNAGSSEFRTKLPKLMDNCDLLMKVGDEYRIETEESSAWRDEFLNQRNLLGNESHRIENERSDRMRKRYGELVKKKNLIQGKSKAGRTMSMQFDSAPPSATDQVTVWVRDGWSIDENSVRVDARQAGNDSSTIFVYLPKRSADDLRKHLIDFKAATITLDKRGVPNSPEGIEAHQAMKTTLATAEEKINQLLNESFQGSRVMQGGGAEISGNNLQEMILEAGEAALTRLYPKFHLGDQTGWDKVYKKAKEGAPDALKMVGHDGEAEKNSVCKAILAQIGAGKKGSELRNHFGEPPYGWGRDSIDGGLQVLLVEGKINARDDKGVILTPGEIERKSIGISLFKVESATVTVPQRIQIRKGFQQVGINASPSEELASVGAFIAKLTELADSAGGEAPKPEPVDKSTIDEIRLASGNEQLLTIYGRREELKSTVADWEDAAKKIKQRMPAWEKLQRLLGQAGKLKAAEEARQQADAIKESRLLLSDPDPITPLVKSVEDTLRTELTAKHEAYQKRINKEREHLETDSSWEQLEPAQRTQFLADSGIKDPGPLNIATQEELVSALHEYPITSWADRIDAVSSRFGQVREKAAKYLVPETKMVQLPRETLRNADEVQLWIDKVKKQLDEAVAKGPIIIK
ncbi:BREX system P-loop protein BrxC [Mariniblastus sp.]|nr:BREX system P-loop protein BrxC [Mariniblastus sp.]